MTRVVPLDIADVPVGRARLNYRSGESFSAPQLAPPSPKKIRIALAGCGVVGGALVRLLHEASGAIEGRHNVRFEIVRVLVRDTARDRGLPIPNHLFTDDISVFLGEEADVVVEAIGGRDIAGWIARASLASGRRFVTANKELISGHALELSALAKKSFASLDFGAAVGGSAPVISLLRDLLGTSSPKSVRGILNGTSNFVLTELERGKPFAEALASARAKGLAEADCSKDLDGRDAAAKLAIIAWIAFGVSPHDLIVRRIGLGCDPAALVREASAVGGRIRLIADCTALDDGTICASVEPVLLSERSALGRTELEDNRVEVDLGWCSPLSVSGPGAGGAPTATALLGDLVSGSIAANDFGLARTAFASVSDPREHRWLIVGCPDGARFAYGTWASIAASVDRFADKEILCSVARVDDAFVAGAVQ
jgi:homoserine dehydrogenase